MSRMPRKELKLKVSNEVHEHSISRDMRCEAKPMNAKAEFTKTALQKRTGHAHGGQRNGSESMNEWKDVGEDEVEVCFAITH